MEKLRGYRLKKKILIKIYTFWVKLKTFYPVYKFFREEDTEFFNSCLRKLGLCERKGLDGQIMLYPVKSKERKLEKEEYHELLGRLYTVRRIDKADHVNVKALFCKITF